MIDREKVINAWEIFRNSNPYQICDGKEFRAIKEPEYCMSQMIEDTITLLKKQQARILDLNELKNWDNAVWFENKDEQDCYIALIANVWTHEVALVNVEPGKFQVVFLCEFYKKEWRCWSARPTIKQRQAVKWE